MKAKQRFYAMGQRRGATGKIAGQMVFAEPAWVGRAYLAGWCAGRRSVGLPERPTITLRKRINTDTFFGGQPLFVEKAPIDPTVREWGK